MMFFCFTGLYYVKPYFINYIIVVHYVGMLKNQIVCIYIWIYIYIFICIYRYIYSYMYIWNYIYMTVHIYIYTYIYIYIYPQPVCMDMFVVFQQGIYCMYVYIYTHVMCMCIYIYIYTLTYHICRFFCVYMAYIDHLWSSLTTPGSSPKISWHESNWRVWILSFVCICCSPWFFGQHDPFSSIKVWIKCVLLGKMNNIT